jgi:hypothetical protein
MVVVMANNDGKKRKRIKKLYTTGSGVRHPEIIDRPHLRVHRERETMMMKSFFDSFSTVYRKKELTSSYFACTRNLAAHTQTRQNGSLSIFFYFDL